VAGYAEKSRVAPFLKQNAKVQTKESDYRPLETVALKPQDPALAPEHILVMPNGDRYWRMLEQDLVKYQSLTQELADLRGRIYALTEIVAQVELKVTNTEASGANGARRRHSAERLLLWIRSTLLPF